MGLLCFADIPVTMPGFSPKPVVLDGPFGLHRRQIHLERQQGRRRQMRRHQHERKLLPKQAEVLEAFAWTFPLPCSRKDLLAYSSRYGASQDRAWKGRQKEDGRARCPQGPQAEAWPQVLFPWSFVT